jgi:hypothetical protein
MAEKKGNAKRLCVRRVEWRCYELNLTIIDMMTLDVAASSDTAKGPLMNETAEMQLRGT